MAVQSINTESEQVKPATEATTEPAAAAVVDDDFEPADKGKRAAKAPAAEPEAVG